ncbi:MAG: hypothetical protein WB760_26420 [Xanthobacteraceae bacterium]
MVKKPDTAEPKPDIRSWYAELLPNYPAAAQTPRLNGIPYTWGRDGKGRRKLINSVRPGSIVEVVDAFLIALGTGRTDVRFRDLVAVMDEIEERDGIIRELSTGHETPRNRKAMRERARQMIINHARRPEANGKLSTGAPRTYPREGHDFEIMCTIQHSRRYDNDDEREVAIEKRLGYCPSRNWLRQFCGGPHDKQQSDKA